MYSGKINTRISLCISNDEINDQISALSKSCYSFIRNSLVRTVFNTPKTCHITPLLASLHWLKIKELSFQYATYCQWHRNLSAVLRKPHTGTTNGLRYGTQFGVPQVCVRMRVRWNSVCRVVARIFSYRRLRICLQWDGKMATSQFRRQCSCLDRHYCSFNLSLQQRCWRHYVMSSGVVASLNNKSREDTTAPSTCTSLNV